MAKQTTKQTSQEAIKEIAAIGAQVKAETEAKEISKMSETQTQTGGEYNGLKWNSTSEVTLKANDVVYGKINLPFYLETMAGQPLEAKHCVALHAHLTGQFRNNETANAKARAARYAKAIAEGKTPDAKDERWTEEQYLDKWLGRGEYSDVGPFFPDIGRTGARLSDDERNRIEAARRAWAQLIADHNAAIDAGEKPVLASLKKQAVVSRPTKTKNVSQTDHDAAVKRWEDAQMAIYNKIMTDEKYAERFQVALDAVLAEQGRAKAEADADSATADLL